MKRHSTGLPLLLPAAEGGPGGHLVLRLFCALTDYGLPAPVPVMITLPCGC